MTTIPFAQQEAIRNLLYIGDQEQDPFSPTFRQERPVLKEMKDPHKKSNTFKNRLLKPKIKISTEPNSLEHSLATTQNKQNLKGILKKLQDSPSPSKNKKNARITKNGFDFHTIETLSSTHQSKYKHSVQKIKEKNKKQIQQLLMKYKHKDMVQHIINEKIIQKMKNIEYRKRENKRGYQKRQKMSTQQSVHDANNPKSNSISLRQKNKEKSYYFNICSEENQINRILNRKNSRITLNQLLF